MFRVIRTLGLALGLLGGLIAAQGPQFAQAYSQRLGGALDELRREIAGLDADAAATGQDREAALESLRNNPDAFVQRRGEAARGDVERLKTLDAQQKALEAATSPIGRLLVILRGPDLAIARATWAQYQIGLPGTGDGLLAGLVGFFVVWGAWRVVTDFLRSMIRRLRRRPAETRAA